MNEQNLIITLGLTFILSESVMIHSIVKFIWDHVAVCNHMIYMTGQSERKCDRIYIRYTIVYCEGLRGIGRNIKGEGF